MPSSEFGIILSDTFFNRFIVYPAIKPAARAPKKPDVPFAAIEPPSIPTASPGLSAIDMAIKPASTGSIKPKATPPICPFNRLASGDRVPKADLCSGVSVLMS